MKIALEFSFEKGSVKAKSVWQSTESQIPIQAVSFPPKFNIQWQTLLTANLAVVVSSIQSLMH